MIRDIFIPEKVGTYYLSPKRIIGFDITKTYVYASQVYCAGSSITLEKFYQEQIDPDVTRSYVERVSQAIRAIMSQAPYCDEMRSSLSSTLIVFKELTLPFLNAEKISLLLPYEIEQSLPFSLHDAVVDFITTKQTVQQGTSDVIAAATQKEYIAEQIVYFEQAGYNPTTLTVDLFDLYGLYRQIPSYATSEETVALIDIEFNITRICFIIDGQLKLVRTLQRGIANIAKTMAQELSAANGKALEDLVRFGLEKHDDASYTTAAQKAMQMFLKDIQFTLQSFITQTGYQEKINKILLLGRGSEINNLEQFFTKNLSIETVLFDTNALLKLPNVSIKTGVRIPRANSISLSTAFPTTITERFNLRQQEFAIPSTVTFYKQFFVAVTLFLSTFLMLFMHSYWQKRTLAHTATAMEKAVVNKLNELDLTDKKQFATALEDAEEKVAREEELWFGFSRQTRFSFLKALQDLSILIDRKGLGLQLKKMIITTNEITLEGEVRGFEELKTLERELRESKLFAYVPTLQELKFNEKLPLRKNNEGPQ
ncbi:MAG: pilus assembly protein PilM [Candidatus Babeliales bacterium]